MLERQHSTLEGRIFDAKNPELEGAAIPAGTCLLGYRGSIAHNLLVSILRRSLSLG